MQRTWLVMAALAAALGASDARAQSSRSPARGHDDGPQLAASDVAMMNATAEKLYRATTVADGATNTWRDTRTGSFGRVTVLGSFERVSRGTGLTCRRVQYDISMKARLDPFTNTVVWCRQPNGEWKAS